MKKLINDAGRYVVEGYSDARDTTPSYSKSFSSYSAAQNYYRKLDESGACEYVRIVDLLGDSAIVDAQSYLFNWRNTYTGEKGKTSVVAGSVEEATKKFTKDIALKGVGTANVFIVSVSPNDGYQSFYGKVSDLLRKYNIDIYDSGNVFVVKDSAGRLYRVFADSFDEAVSKVKNYKKF